MVIISQLKHTSCLMLTCHAISLASNHNTLQTAQLELLPQGISAIKLSDSLNTSFPTNYFKANTLGPPHTVFHYTCDEFTFTHAHTYRIHTHIHLHKSVYIADLLCHGCRRLSLLVPPCNSILQTYPRPGCI